MSAHATPRKDFALLLIGAAGAQLRYSYLRARSRRLNRKILVYDGTVPPAHQAIAGPGNP